MPNLSPSGSEGCLGDVCPAIYIVDFEFFNRLVAVEALEHKNETFFDRLSLIFEFVVELRTKK